MPTSNRRGGLSSDRPNSAPHSTADDRCAGALGQRFSISPELRVRVARGNIGLAGAVLAEKRRLGSGMLQGREPSIAKIAGWFLDTPGSPNTDRCQFHTDSHDTENKADSDTAVSCLSSPIQGQS